MKMTYLILAIVLIVAITFLANRKKTNSPTGSQSAKDSAAATGKKLDRNPYNDMKALAYNTKYEDLALADAGDREVLYGVLMDWDYEGKAIVTLTSFKTGDASVYLSSGTIIIGAGQHAEVAAASKEFIRKAEALLVKADDSDTALKTEPGMLKFYLLTNKGRYTVKDPMENVNNGSSFLNGIFDDANKLIAFVRVAADCMEQRGK